LINGLRNYLPEKHVNNTVGDQSVNEKEISEDQIFLFILEEIKNRVLGSPIPSSSEVSIS
jgi:hypothetical protein